MFVSLSVSHATSPTDWLYGVTLSFTLSVHVSVVCPFHYNNRIRFLLLLHLWVGVILQKPMFDFFFCVWVVLFVFIVSTDDFSCDFSLFTIYNDYLPEAVPFLSSSTQILTFHTLFHQQLNWSLQRLLLYVSLWTVWSYIWTFNILIWKKRKDTPHYWIVFYLQTPSYSLTA